MPAQIRRPKAVEAEMSAVAGMPVLKEVLISAKEEAVTETKEEKPEEEEVEVEAAVDRVIVAVVAVETVEVHRVEIAVELRAEIVVAVAPQGKNRID